MEDASWCLTCNRQLEIEAEPSPLIADDDPFHSSDEDEDVPIPRQASSKGHPKVRHGTVKARQHVHPIRKNQSSGKLAQRGKFAISSAVTTAVQEAKQPAVTIDTQVPLKPEWSYLYCSEECMRIDEQRARLGLANLEPPRSPRVGPVGSSYGSPRSDSMSRMSSGSRSRRGSTDLSSASPILGRLGSSTNLQALTPLVESTPTRSRRRSHSPNGPRSQSEDLGGRSGSYEPSASPRLSSSMKSTTSSPMVFGTLRPESAAFMRPSSLGRVTSSKSLATIGLTGTSASAHAYDAPLSPGLPPQSRPSAHRSSLSQSSIRLDTSDPDSPNSLFSRSSVSTAPSSSRWAEEPPSVDGPHDPSKSPLHTGYGLYHRLPNRNASSSSLSRSPPSALYMAPVTSMTGGRPQSAASPRSEPQGGYTISDVFRAGQARRTASSVSIAAMNPEAGPSTRQRPPFLHMKQHSSASSDSSAGSSPLPSPALLTSGNPQRMWQSASAVKEGRRPSFVYEAMPDTPTKQALPRNSSEGDVVNAAGAQMAAKARRKRLFAFPDPTDY